MPIEKLPTNGTEYLLAVFDKEGHERSDDPHGRMTEVIAHRLRDGGITDVFLFSHGWMGDVPAARSQYSRWIANLQSVAPADARPLYVGLHWPSLPFGDQDLQVSFWAAGQAGGELLDPLIAAAADSLDCGEESLPALHLLFEAAATDPGMRSLSKDVLSAYAELARQPILPDQHPGSDGQSFDPELAWEAAALDGGIGSPEFGFAWSRVLAPLRPLSFWRMKARACRLGEGGIGRAVSEWRAAAPNLRFHLMGHSLGCILMSAVARALRQPADSLVLVQGAMSHWSFTSRVPGSDSPGYFHGLPDQVNGPVVTTTSRHDRAVGWLYPLAAGVARQVTMAPAESLPKYGALGAFGACGDGFRISRTSAGAVGSEYQLGRNEVSNVECSSVIREGGGVAGAHSDIARPEVAWLQWAAAGSLIS